MVALGRSLSTTATTSSAPGARTAPSELVCTTTGSSDASSVSGLSRQARSNSYDAAPSVPMVAIADEVWSAAAGSLASRTPARSSWAPIIWP